MSFRSHSQLANFLVNFFEGERNFAQGGEGNKITVNPLVSEVASWYEKLRTAMDYRAEEVILRAAIERILKRRLFLGGTGQTIAEPLIRELVWARYFSTGRISEATIKKVAGKIDLYLRLREKIFSAHKKPHKDIDEWISQLMSSDLEQILNPNTEEDMMRNFMFQVLKEKIEILDDTRETRDAQVFLAVSRAFAKDDKTFLRFHLFKQFFGELKEENLETVALGFLDYYKETTRQLNYRLRERIYTYVKSQTPPFLILRDIFMVYRGNIRSLLASREHLKEVVFRACEARYAGIAENVRRALIRSIIFILLTKAVLALAIEGTYETLVSGQIFWSSMALNISIPPLLMIIAAFFIRTPGRDNSERIFSRIESLLFDSPPELSYPLRLKLAPDKTKPLQNAAFTLLWLSAFVLSFGFIFFILARLNFNILTQGVFVFFLAVVSFLSYRISQTAHTYTVEERSGLITPVVDFLFIPIVRVGRHLTEGITQFDIILFIFDFVIETPFKGLFAFFEQWFFFLQRKREELG